MSEENTDGPFKVDFKEIKDKKFKTVEECVPFLMEWALNLGFMLIKESSMKAYGVYLKCHCNGKARRNPEAEGKRMKKSKKTGTILAFIYNLCRMLI